MAGRGPAPKDPEQRARRNKDPIPRTEIPFVKAKQPVLPARMPGGEAWPARTRAWWRRWGTDPRAKRFDAAAWDELLDTAVVHGRLWSGEWKAASELRLRMAKFGTTPEDRARMRVALSDGLEEVVVGGEDAGRVPEPARRDGARERYGALRVVSGSSSDG